MDFYDNFIVRCKECKSLAVQNKIMYYCNNNNCSNFDLKYFKCPICDLKKLTHGVYLEYGK